MSDSNQTTKKEHWLHGKRAAMTYRCGQLMDEARLALAGTTTEGINSRGVLLFSYMTVEAFMNDLALHLEVNWYPLKNTPLNLPESVLALAGILPDLESDRLPLRAKIQVMYFILTGKHLPKDREPFRSFLVLDKVRNRLAHGKPMEYVFERNVAMQKQSDRKFARELVAVGAASKSFADGYGDWEAPLWRQECGQWAFKTVSELLLLLVNSLPDFLALGFKIALRLATSDKMVEMDGQLRKK